MKSEVYNYECPQCNAVKPYKNKHSYDNAVAAKRICQECQTHNWLKEHPSAFNETACKVMDILNNAFNWKLQHALNGGEFVVPGTVYRVDGYDKEKGIIFEYDEKHHEQQRQQDIMRSNCIIKSMAEHGYKSVYLIRYSDFEDRFYLDAAIVNGEQFTVYGVRKNRIQHGDLLRMQRDQAASKLKRYEANR